MILNDFSPYFFKVYSFCRFYLFIRESVYLTNNDWPASMDKQMLIEHSDFLEGIQEISYISQLPFALNSLSVPCTLNFIISNRISHNILKSMH